MHCARLRQPGPGTIDFPVIVTLDHDDILHIIADAISCFGQNPITKKDCVDLVEQAIRRAYLFYTCEDEEAKSQAAKLIKEHFPELTP